MTLLTDRTAVITGAANPTGIGYAAAQAFARHGARVAILDLPTSPGETVAKDLGSAAVFVSLTLVLLVWAAVAFDRFVVG